MSFIPHILSGALSTEVARQEALDRIHSDPGLPEPKPTVPFWTQNEKLKGPHSQSAHFPSSSDIVIIGSGITAASVAYSLLSLSSSSSLTTTATKEKQLSELPVTILEARETCNGATGRNGGHILPAIDHYADLKAACGKENAIDIMRFEFACRDDLIDMAQREGLTETAQVRKVQYMSVYLDKGGWQRALTSMDEFKKDFPEESKKYALYDSTQASEKFNISRVAGVLSGPAGAMWPYKFVTGLLRRLQERYPARFLIEINTYVTEIQHQSDYPYPYQIITNRGTIEAKHVIHCTNGHVGHLAPGFQGLVFPVRGQCSAQIPGNRFKHQGNDTSWLISYREGFDYLTQLPIQNEISNGEMILGGGVKPSSEAGLGEIGNSDDANLNLDIEIHLSGALGTVFGRENWGHTPGPGPSVKTMWSGVMGFSSDGVPWVGRLPSSLTRRAEGQDERSDCSEWAATGYSGEGMVFAWLCGKSLARQFLLEVFGLDVEADDKERMKLPDALKITEKRIARARLPIKVEDLAM